MVYGHKVTCSPNLSGWICRSGSWKAEWPSLVAILVLPETIMAEYIFFTNADNSRFQVTSVKRLFASQGLSSCLCSWWYMASELKSRTISLSTNCATGGVIFISANFCDGLLIVPRQMSGKERIRQDGFQDAPSFRKSPSSLWNKYSRSWRFRGKCMLSAYSYIMCVATTVQWELNY